MTSSQSSSNRSFWEEPKASSNKSPWKCCPGNSESDSSPVASTLLLLGDAAEGKRWHVLRRVTGSGPAVRRDGDVPAFPFLCDHSSNCNSIHAKLIASISCTSSTHNTNVRAMLTLVATPLFMTGNVTP